MTTAFTFPGQGSQAPGMGKALADAFGAARDVFGEVDEALSQNLSKLMFEGPEGDLTLTENAQPALMAVSMAIVRVLEREGGFRLAERCSYVAGHSLGEYSALVAAGAFSLSDGAKLLKARGQAMQRAVPSCWCVEPRWPSDAAPSGFMRASRICVRTLPPGWMTGSGRYWTTN